MSDEQVTSLLLYAEKECKKIRIGKVDFSLEVSKAIEIWYFQRVALKIVQRRVINCRELCRLATKLNISACNLGNI